MKTCPVEKCHQCPLKIDGRCTNNFEEEEEGTPRSRKQMFRFPELNMTMDGPLSVEEFDRILDGYRQEVDAQAYSAQLWFAQEEQRLCIISGNESVFSAICRREVM